MNYLRIAVIACVMLVMVFALLVVANASTDKVTVYNVYDIEQAVRIATLEGNTFTCLLTSEGNGFTGDSDKWIGFTCAEMGTIPVTWQFCKGIAGKPLLLCVPPGTVLRNGKGDIAAPRAKPDIEMQLQ